MRKVLLILISLFVISCKQGNNPQMTTATNEIDTSLFHKKLQIANKDVQLLPEAQKATSNWLAYVTAQSEMENFNTYTVREVSSNSSPIAEIMLSLRETVPDSLNSNAVISRLNVLYTKSRVLQQLAEKRTPHPSEIKKTAEEIPADFNNFKIQLNELYLKSLADFEKELDAQQKETSDSISRAKRRQKRNDTLKPAIN